MKKLQDKGKTSDAALIYGSGNRQLIFYSSVTLLYLIIIYLAYNLIQKIDFRSNADDSKFDSPPKKILQVEVLNGCGIAGAGDVITNFLRQKGFDVISTGNYQNFDVDETIIIDRVGNISTGFKIADSLGIPRVNTITQINRGLLLDATIIIGKDFNSFQQK